MTEADSIIRDSNVAVEFAQQIFPPEVQQSMIGRRDFKVFQDGIHGAVKGLYTSYEIGIRLRAARREIEQQEERIRSLEARMEKAERDLRKVKAAGEHSAEKSNPIIEERVTLSEEPLSICTKGFALVRGEAVKLKVSGLWNACINEAALGTQCSHELFREGVVSKQSSTLYEELNKTQSCSEE